MPLPHAELRRSRRCAWWGSTLVNMREALSQAQQDVEKSSEWGRREMLFFSLFFFFISNNVGFICLSRPLLLYFLPCNEEKEACMQRFPWHSECQHQSSGGVLSAQTWKSNKWMCGAEDWENAAEWLNTIQLIWSGSVFKLFRKTEVRIIIKKHLQPLLIDLISFQYVHASTRLPFLYYDSLCAALRASGGGSLIPFIQNVGNWWQQCSQTLHQIYWIYMSSILPVLAVTHWGQRYSLV